MEVVAAAANDKIHFSRILPTTVEVEILSAAIVSTTTAATPIKEGPLLGRTTRAQVSGIMVVVLVAAVTLIVDRILIIISNHNNQLTTNSTQIETPNPSSKASSSSKASNNSPKTSIPSTNPTIRETACRSTSLTLHHKKHTTFCISATLESSMSFATLRSR